MRSMLGPPNSSADQKSARRPLWNRPPLRLTQPRAARTNTVRGTPMTMKPRMLMQFVLALGFVVGACSNADKGKATDAGASASSDTQMDFCTLPPACQQISQACMPKDDGSKGPVHDCHMTGMVYAIAANC